MIERVIKFFTSLRLTVVLLAFGIILVFVGTVAQADEGLYQAQARYFKHWYVWGVTMFGYKVPLLLPGGYLIGTLLLINLTAAHIKRFQFTTKKLGIHLTHLGVILLLVGQLATDLFSRETQLRFTEGEAKSWSESDRNYELAFVTDLDANNEQVIAIPESIVARGGDIKHEKLPFTVRVKSYWPNSDSAFRAPMQENAPPLTANGVARNFDFRPTPMTHAMDSKNVPTAVLELSGPTGSLGTWVASGWSGDETMAMAVRRSYYERAGAQIADSILQRLTEAQSVEVGGKKYTFALRPTRAYAPYSMTLLKTTHSVYAGTDTPKDFRSRVRLNNPVKGEDREVEIYMNNPLRYQGLTFYQHQMAGEQLAARWGEKPSSVLQVVRNPSWLTPYAGCLIVAGGLIIQFMIHLVGFISRRKAA
jgi:hypothetical protein